MDPNLEKYINDSRASGMSNEQILAQLRNSGWSEADIPADIRGSAASSTASSLSIGFGLKKIIITILVLGLLGGTGYFLFGRSNPDSNALINTNQPSNNTQNNSTNNSSTTQAKQRLAGLSCESILSYAEFAALVNKSVSDVATEETVENKKDGSMTCDYITKSGGAAPLIVFETKLILDEPDAGNSMLGCDLGFKCISVPGQSGIYTKVTHDGTDDSYGFNVVDAAGSVGAYHVSCTYHTGLSSNPKGGDKAPLTKATSQAVRCVEYMQANLK